VGTLKTHFVAVKSKWTYTNRYGTVTTTPSASEHSLFSQDGYFGPRLPPPPAIHDYDMYHDHITAAKGNYFQSWSDGSSAYSFGDHLSTNPSSVVLLPEFNWDNLYARTLDKLNDQVRGGMDISVDLAQGRQVMRMLNAQERVYDYTKTFLKKRFGVIRTLATLRLEYMYGVKPLMDTAFKGADELLRHQLNRMARYRARVVDKSYKPTSVMVQSFFGPTWSTSILSSDVKMSTTLGVTMVVNEDNHWDLRKWSSLNPYSIAYEMVPYSFVADWFYDIGGYLRNMETAMAYGFDFQTGYRSDLAAFSGSMLRYVPYVSYPYGYESYQASYRGLRFKRRKLSWYPSPQKPTLQVDLGSSRLLNGAALLANMLGSTGESDMKVPRGYESNRYRERVNNSRNITFKFKR